MPTITEKINFPIERLPEGIVQYTKPSETIDSNNEDIIRLASQLVAGEDDLYDAVFKIADWTKNNIQYDLSTLTAEVSQKASWVLFQITYFIIIRINYISSIDSRPHFLHIYLTYFSNFCLLIYSSSFFL